MTGKPPSLSKIRKYIKKRYDGIEFYYTDCDRSPMMRLDLAAVIREFVRKETLYERKH